jgi:hypothetical protein
VDGRIVEHPLAYLNSRKTGFTDGLQINTHDLWLINFVDDNFDFAGERQRLNKRMDTIFLRNGRILHGNVVEFNERTGNFTFSRLSPIHESQIKRLYFCCQEFPDAFRNKRRLRRPKRY